MDRERLTKVLALTTSDNDAEALAAIRKANDLIKAEGLMWSDVLQVSNVVNITLQRPGAGPPAAQAEDWVAPHLKDKVVIDLMFRAVFSQPRSDNEEFWTFMDSIHHRWDRHENLTQGQYNALRRCYNRVVRRPA